MSIKIHKANFSPDWQTSFFIELSWWGANICITKIEA